MKKSLDWNEMSELGLIRRINSEVLHPLGLAMSREVETGISKAILIADDGVWEYSDPPKVNLTADEIRDKVREIAKRSGHGGTCGTRA